LKIEVSQEALFEALTIVGRAIAGRTTLPVLSHVLIQAEQGQLTLVGSNLEVFITCPVDSAHVEQDGSIAIPAALLTDLVKNLDGTIGLNLDEDILHLTCGKNRANIKGIDANKYPILPEQPDTSILRMNVELFKQLLSQALFCCAQDESRPALTGVFFYLAEGTLTLASADGYRLSVVQAKINDSTSASAIVPGKVLGDLLKLLPNRGECEMSLLGSRAYFALPNDVEIGAQLIERKFVNYAQIVPKAHATKVVVDIAPLLKMLKPAFIFSKQETNFVNLSIAGGTLSVRASGSELGEYNSQIPVNIEGPDLDIALNVIYFMDALNAATSKQANLYFSGSANPMKLIDGDFTHILMPMHVRD